MLYDISLRITYDYANPADAGRHLVRLLPANLSGEQRVIVSTLDIRPEPAERIHRSDFFGNSCVEIAFDQPVRDTVFQMKARVDRIAPEAFLDVSPDMAGLQQELDGLDSVGPMSPHHFRGASPRVAPDGDITAWARHVTHGRTTAFTIAEALSTALYDEMTFDPEATVVETPFVEAFRMRRGVCQDFTHIAIAALRGLGIPAGYVSGFLRTIPPEGAERLEGADAMHAWVRAWCGMDMGWVEFDPTNAMLAGADHVVIARGRDYADVSPVRGAMRMSGAQTTTQAVDVVLAV